MLHGAGFDYPGVWGGQAHEHFPPIIRQVIQGPHTAYCELSYSFPRVGEDGIVAAVWCNDCHADWQQIRVTTGLDLGDALQAMQSLPVWLLEALERFTAKLAEGLRKEEDDAA
jgi:hypothetical protein